MAFNARILKDSESPHGVRLTTMEVTFPRIVLAEFNTHRMFSRNSASSRAIPIEKRIAAVESDPFIPEAFGKNKKGMQADVNLSGDEEQQARDVWAMALADSVIRARDMSRIGVHKQLANRILEPFLWQTVIVSATEWNNFFALRCHPDAQPEIRKVAELMKLQYDSSRPVKQHAWHLPLVDDEKQLKTDGYVDEDIHLISAGRCARVSYLTHDGKRDPAADIDLANKLQSSGHMSPFEHIARVMTDSEAMSIAKTTPEDTFCGNFRGWKQLRKMLAYEDDFSKAKKIV